MTSRCARTRRWPFPGAVKVNWLQQPLPKPDPGAGFFQQAAVIFKREWLGIVGILAYLFVIPPLLAVTVFRKFYIKMGFIRFMLLMNLIQFMLALPLKMILRWTINLKYIVYIPEYFFNI